MSQIDQFESVFRSAVKDSFQFEAFELHSCLLVTDLKGTEAEAYFQAVKAFASVLHDDQQKWTILTANHFQSTGDLLDRVVKINPDVIFSYRNLHSQAWRFPHSLGEHLDVLLQRASMPVLVLPHPQAGYALEHAVKTTSKVMAVTDHLANDHKLVNLAHRFTQEGGELYLVHIEDEKIFRRMIDAISKIPTIDTENAEKTIREQLLKAPREYVQSCRKVLQDRGDGITIKEIIGFGHRLRDYNKYIDQMQVDLLAMHTKDDDQLAMHGIAYPLAIEVRQIPLLML